MDSDPDIGKGRRDWTEERGHELQVTIGTASTRFFHFNPRVSGGALILIWAFVAVCMGVREDTLTVTVNDLPAMNEVIANLDEQLKVVQDFQFAGTQFRVGDQLKGPRGYSAKSDLDDTMAVVLPSKFVFSAIDAASVAECQVVGTAEVLRKPVTMYMMTTEFRYWMNWVTRTWTWLYIGTQDVWLLFLAGVFMSKYGKLRLGPQDSRPEWNDATWFAMLFSCGLGIGMFYFGVAEPVWHYEGCYGGPNWADTKCSGNRISELPPDKRAQEALNLTLLHWGLHGWIVYCVLGLLLGFLNYRKGLPMTMKTCFYPLIGDRIYGVLGDCVDILSIICTLFGVCTSLGLGVMQLNAGLARISFDENAGKSTIEENLTNQVIIIWCVTACATLSTLSGLQLGIRRLSEMCFGFGCFLMLAVLFLDDTWYILDVVVQSVGHYFQWIIELGFKTDAFVKTSDKLNTNYPYHPTLQDVQIHTGSSAAPSKLGGSFTQDSWMNDWTIFYWGWWIAWSPFVAIFIATVSKGRTVRQFIIGTLTLPVAYSMVWFCIFGGAGIKMEREAAVQGLCQGGCSFSTGRMMFPNNSLAPLGYGAPPCADPADIAIAESRPGFCTAADGSAMAHPMLVPKVHPRTTKANTYRLSCRAKNDMWFDVISQYGVTGEFFIGASLVAIILYFVTSSDSGSLVIDILGSNGDKDPPRMQRFFWSMMEGITATTLLVVGNGSTDALSALQAASITAGLPFTFIICFCCVSLWRAFKYECGELDWYGPRFETGLLDLFAVRDTELLKYVKALFLPSLSLKECVDAHVAKVGVNSFALGGKGIAVVAGVLQIAWIVCLCVDVEAPGLWAIGWVMYIALATLIATVRYTVREHNGIVGNLVEDWFAAIILYAPALVQCLDKIRHESYRDTSLAESKGGSVEADTMASSGAGPCKSHPQQVEDLEEPEKVDPPLVAGLGSDHIEGDPGGVVPE